MTRLENQARMVGTFTGNEYLAANVCCICANSESLVYFLNFREGLSILCVQF